MAKLFQKGIFCQESRFYRSEPREPDVDPGQDHRTYQERDPRPSTSAPLYPTYLLAEVTELGSKHQKLTLGVSWFEQDLSTLKDVYEQEEEIRLYLRVKGFFYHMINFTQRVLINR